MENKYCSKCDKIKNINDFHNRTRKSGSVYVCKYCKECEKQRKKEPEYVKKALKRHKIYCKENREIILENTKIYQSKNIEKISEYQKIYHKIENNVNRRNQRRRYRRQTDNEYRIMCSLSSRITKLLKSNKTIKTNKLIGCSVEDFKKWLEFQFDTNMTWNNYGNYWHIDHVVPCNSFNLEILDEQYTCFNWKNCRPLEKIKNIIKSDNIYIFQTLLQELKVCFYNKFATRPNCGEVLKT